MVWESLIEAVKPYLNAVLIGFGGFLLAFILSQIVSRLLNKSLGKGWSKFLGNLLGLAVIIWTLKLILESAGAAGFVVVIVTAVTGAFALGSEQIASDLVAGVSLFFSQIYKPGEYVSIAGYEGKVVDTSLWLTTLESVNGDRIYIRNSEVTGGTIINYSVQPGHLISVQLILPSNQDLNIAVVEIEKAISGFCPELESTRETYRPRVSLESAEYGFVNVVVQAYVPEALDYAGEKTRLYLLAFTAMKNAGLDLWAG